MKYYFLLSSLPSLELSSSPELPISVEAFWQKISSEETVSKLIHCILLAKDLTNLEQSFYGESPTTPGTIPLEVLPKIFSEDALRKKYIPEEITWSENWTNEIWNSYYEYCDTIAAKHSTCFSSWLDWDQQLRKAFAVSRSERVKAEFSLKQERIALEFHRITEAYYKADNPLEAEKVLQQNRWDKISSMAEHFSFDLDELVSYGLKLLILERWWNISQSTEDIFEKVLNV